MVAFSSGLLRAHKGRLSSPNLDAAASTDNAMQDAPRRRAVNKLAFLFAPVGWQRVDMGRQLYEKDAGFRRVVLDVAREMSAKMPMDLLEVLYPSKESAVPMGDLIDSANFAQPALFAVETALDALWRSRGVIPDALVGHSLGELAAACSGNGGLPLFDHDARFDHGLREIDESEEDEDDAKVRQRVAKRVRARRARAGPLTRREAAKCVLARATLMANSPSMGCMMAIRESEDACLAAIAALARCRRLPLTTKLAKGKACGVAVVAAVNTPGSTVISGDYIAMSLVVAQLKKHKIVGGCEDTTVRVRKVRATHADHSPCMEAIGTALAAQVTTILQDSERELEKVGVSPKEPSQLAFVSTVTGDFIAPSDLRVGEYWARHATGSVRFVDAIKKLATTHGVFVDIGDGMLASFGKATLDSIGTQADFVSSLAGQAEKEVEVFEKALKDARTYHSRKEPPSPSMPIPPKFTTKGRHISPLASIVVKVGDGPKAHIQCKIQPPPNVLQADPKAMTTKAHDRTLTVSMPQNSSFHHFIAFLEYKYTMRLHVYDALLLCELKAVSKPIEDDEAFDAALMLAAKKEMNSAYFVVRPKFDEHGKTMPCRRSTGSEVSPQKAEVERHDSRSSFSKKSLVHIDENFITKAIEREADTKKLQRQRKNSWTDAGMDKTHADTKRWAEAVPEALEREDAVGSLGDAIDKATGLLNSLVGEYDPKIGRRRLKDGYACQEFEPFPLLSEAGVGEEDGSEEEEEVAAAAEFLEARRGLIDAMPEPSLLPEDAFPSDSMGGRCLDKWRYRWGQRANDLWLYMPLPSGLTSKEVRVKFNVTRVGVFFRDVALYDGALWNVDERKGIDVQTAAWVVVTDGDFAVLHIEMYKKTPGWWKAVWADHPTIEPWEVPDWKAATFNDGYHNLT
ncbi:hypothetical protein CTAYLR_001555 [Chrysophaeum taylorii]|uniref:CS domain-containing protein n=1 Tax=Chrysophaeum taylorii TaxID=2483200 RepID=A0AAD7XLR6_9STRA|nr:hypothetical protein CTAYLR_001555 [Chrysophaeum taylorii]